MFDPPTMALLASSPGMIAALQLWKSLLLYNSPTQLLQACSTFEAAFSQGSCAFTVSGFRCSHCPRLSHTPMPTHAK